MFPFYLVNYKELCLGVISERSKKAYLEIIERLAGSGAEGVILGCTEIGLLVQQKDPSLPVFDTAQIHATSAALQSIGNETARARKKIEGAIDMDVIEAIKNRHSVRAYTDKRIEGTVLAELQAEIGACNNESGLHLQLITNEPDAFSGLMAHYGKFNNVKNYVALIGKKEPDLNEKIGYYGERIALKAQQLGLNSCWVALTFRKGKTKGEVGQGEKLVCVLSLGYGTTQGVPHKSKPIHALCKTSGDTPDWFWNALEAAALAPTATNQQKFLITRSDGAVAATATGGFYSDVDLGIVKYHFEVAAGRENFVWE